MNHIEYFKNFEEGDNITITADFINHAENLCEHINTIHNFLAQKNKEINELNDNIEIMHKYIKILIKEIDDNE